MTTVATAKPRHKAAKAAKAAPLVYRTFATHQDMLDDMEAFRRKVTASPEAARAFLVSAGLITKDGKQIQLIRD